MFEQCCRIRPPTKHGLGWCRDVALYALGVGACNADAADEKELQLVYHRDGQSSIKVLKMSWWGCVRLIFFSF